MQTLSELIECFQLYAVCEACQRIEDVDLAKLIESEGANYPIAKVRARLCCRKCKKRSQALRIVYVGPEGRASAFRYRR